MSTVTHHDDGTWGFECPEPSGCAPFVSTGWPTRASATKRLEQHKAEHETGEPMQELEAFRTDNNLVVVDGVAKEA
jgi:hypothetical protein